MKENNPENSGRKNLKKLDQRMIMFLPQSRTRVKINRRGPLVPMKVSFSRKSAKHFCKNFHKNRLTLFCENNYNFCKNS